MDETYKVKIARATDEEIARVREFMFKLDEMIPAEGEMWEVGDFICDCWEELSPSLSRILMGYDALVYSFCDKSVSYLCLKPELFEENDANPTN